MAFKRKFTKTGLAMRCVREMAPHGASSDGHLGHHPFPNTTSEAPKGCVHSRMPGQRLLSPGSWGLSLEPKGTAPDAQSLLEGEKGRYAGSGAVFMPGGSGRP